MSRVLVVGDMHEPFTLPGYRQFCQSIYRKYKCNRVVLIGDEVDQHASSFHSHDPDGMSAGEELKLATKRLKRWEKAFPKAFVCIGNHTHLVQRQAKEAGISAHWIKSYNDVYGIKGWTWGFNTEIDDVLYFHGCGYNGAGAPRQACIAKRQKCVFGHIHSGAGIQYAANERDLIWGFNVGCGIDVDSYSMSYGKDFKEKPIISCGVVIDGVPYLEPMNLGTRYPANRRK